MTRVQAPYEGRSESDGCLDTPIPKILHIPFMLNTLGLAPNGGQSNSCTKCQGRSIDWGKCHVLSTLPKLLLSRKELQYSVVGILNIVTLGGKCHVKLNDQSTSPACVLQCI